MARKTIHPCDRNKPLKGKSLEGWVATEHFVGNVRRQSERAIVIRKGGKHLPKRRIDLPYRCFQN